MTHHLQIIFSLYLTGIMQNLLVQLLYFHHQLQQQNISIIVINFIAHNHVHLLSQLILQLSQMIVSIIHYFSFLKNVINKETASINNKIIKQKMSNYALFTNRSITNHPTLASQTKFAHQFSKTKRFSAKNAQCPEAFYIFESQLSDRKASFGYGQKSDFTKTLTVSPPATKYNMKSEFDDIKKGQSFGCAREKSPDKSYLIPQIQKNPGPGNYENQVKTRMNQTYSMRSKTIDIINKKSTNRYTPGPAAYQSIDFQNQSGRYIVSKYPDARMAKINPNTKRFPDVKQSPGPMTYEQQEGFPEKGKYTLSTHTGYGNRAFDKQARFTFHHWKPTVNPGPGRYNVPTEFPSLTQPF